MTASVFRGYGMHSHDRTLLQSLGFQDEDKKDPLHELACRYVFEKVESIFPAPDPSKYLRRWSVEYEVPLTDRWNKPVAFLDLVLSADIKRGPAIVEAEELVASLHKERRGTPPSWNHQLEHHEAGILNRRETASYAALQAGLEADRNLAEGHLQSLRMDLVSVCAVEVKVSPVPVGDVLRQVNTYKKLGADCSWLVVICWQPSADFAQTLEHDDIRIVTLGEVFRTWAAGRQKERATCLSV